MNYTEKWIISKQMEKILWIYTVQYCSTLTSIINYNVLLLRILGNGMAVFYLVEDSSTLISFLIGKKEPILIIKKKSMNWRHAGATISITETLNENDYLSLTVACSKKKMCCNFKGFQKLISLGLMPLLTCRSSGKSIIYAARSTCCKASPSPLAANTSTSPRTPWKDCVISTLILKTEALEALWEGIHLTSVR